MKTTILLLLVPALAFAIEDKLTEHKSFSGAHELIIDNVTGSIDVAAWNGLSVEVDVTRTLKADSADRIALAKREVKLDVAQEGGLVRLMPDGSFRNHGGAGYQASYDFKVRVPKTIRLDLRTVNRSDIAVRGTSGEFKISNVNGEIDMRDVEGSGSVHTVNGPVKVTFARNPDGPVSFKSVNGTLDVAFRSDLNANVRLRSLSGSFFTDFATARLPVSEEFEHRDGVRILHHSAAAVRIGNGGPELTFETVNGEVLIRNREK